MRARNWLPLDNESGIWTKVAIREHIFNGVGGLCELYGGYTTWVVQAVLFTSTGLYMEREIESSSCPYYCDQR